MDHPLESTVEGAEERPLDPLAIKHDMEMMSGMWIWWLVGILVVMLLVVLIVKLLKK